MCIIRVDRSVPPAYPEWVTRVLHPELEALGPAEYELAAIEPWLHEGQKNSSWGVRGTEIYKHLRNANMLQRCLDLRDGEEILKLGPRVFRKLFGGKSLVLWRSAVEFEGDIRIPTVPYGGEGKIGWWFMVSLRKYRRPEEFDIHVPWRHLNPAALFPST